MSRGTIYNSNLTSDYDKVLEENKNFVSDFIMYMKSSDRSPATLTQYFEWLKVFFCWNYKENNNKLFTNLKRRDFVHYFGWCRDLGMSASRVAALKSALSSMSNEIELLYEDEYPNFRNQIRGLEPVKISRVREKTIISNEQMTDILKGLIDKKEYQVACYVALACASGSRKAELLQMNTSFFTPENEVFSGYMYCTPEIRAKGRGKRGKRIKKYVIKELFKPFFDAWMEERERLGINCDALFVTKKDGEYVPANVTTANSFAAKVSKCFNINYYTHSSRHYFCTYLKKMELPDDIVVQIIGWSESTGSTMLSIYDDTDRTEKMEKFFQAFLNEQDDEDEEE